MSTIKTSQPHAHQDSRGEFGFMPAALFLNHLVRPSDDHPEHLNDDSGHAEPLPCHGVHHSQLWKNWWPEPTCQTDWTVGSSPIRHVKDPINLFIINIFLSLTKELNRFERGDQVWDFLLYTLASYCRNELAREPSQQSWRFLLLRHFGHSNSIIELENKSSKLKAVRLVTNHTLWYIDKGILSEIIKEIKRSLHCRALPKWYRHIWPWIGRMVHRNEVLTMKLVYQVCN